MFLWFYKPFMNGTGLNTIGPNMDVILGLIWTKTMALVGLSNRFDGGIGFGLHLWIGHVPWTFDGHDSTLLA